MPKLERYLVFAGWNYYPMGGWDDFEGSFATLVAAETSVGESNAEWKQIIDSETGEEIAN